MIKRVLAVLVAIAMVSIVVLSLSAPVSAADDNKQVTFCHATGVDGKYNKLTLPLAGFLNGHYDHGPGGNDDIWEAFSYTNKKGEVVNIAANGDTSLLAFEDCAKPVVDDVIPVPDPQYADPCGTENDVFSVPGGTGYTVGPVVVNGDSQSITLTAADGFVFADGKTVTITKPAFTNVDCDLPETGENTVNVLGGLAALVIVAFVGLYMFKREN